MPAAPTTSAITRKIKGRRKKQFFLERKNQRTFCVPARRSARQAVSEIQPDEPHRLPRGIRHHPANTPAPHRSAFPARYMRNARLVGSTRVSPPAAAPRITPGTSSGVHPPKSIRPPADQPLCPPRQIGQRQALPRQTAPCRSAGSSRTAQPRPHPCARCSSPLFSRQRRKRGIERAGRFLPQRLLRPPPNSNAQKSKKAGLDRNKVGGSRGRPPPKPPRQYRRCRGLKDPGVGRTDRVARIAS